MNLQRLAFAYIPSPAQNGFSIGPLPFHVYGLMYVAAVTAAIVIGRRRWAKLGGDPELIYECARWGFPAGLIGGRLYFDITTPSQVPDHWWGPFAIWDGGLGIWGGMTVAVLVSAWRLRRQLSWPEVRQFMDAAAPALLVAQGIGRIGNYFNQELFGKPSTLPWALKIAPQFRPAGYARYATFQPSFLYELIFDFAWAGFMVWLGHHRKIRAPGLFALYVTGYCAYRIFEEQIRIDYSNYILGMRLNFWVALLGAVGGALWFLRIQTRPDKAISGDGGAGPRAPAKVEYSQPGAV